MWRSYNFELKQESHSFQEKRCSMSTTYPSTYDNKYYAPPSATMHKIDNHPPYYYEPSDVEEEEDDHHHYHHHQNRHLVHHDPNHGNRGNWWETHHQDASNYNHAYVKNKQQGNQLLRPPTHQYHHHVGIGYQGKEASRTNTNNRNQTMEDYPRKYFHKYGDFSRVEDEHDNNVVGEELEYPLMNGLMHGKNRVKKIEVIEYERRTLRGGRQEWIVLGGNGASYPKSHAPWVKGY